MNFNIFSNRIYEIEKETSRNKISNLLTQFFKDLSPEEAKRAAYILLGSIGPNYQGKRFNLATKNILSFLSEYISLNFQTELLSDFLETNQKIGDPGQAVFLFLESHQHAKIEETPISFLEVYEELEILVNLSGEGSINLKLNSFLSIFSKLSNLGKKYFIRIISGNLQLGFSTITLLDSFSNIDERNNKNLKKELEANYNVCADIGRIIFLLKTNDLDSLKNPEPMYGIPVSPAAAERVEDLSELLTRMKRFVVQPKLDGLRVQIHRFTENESCSVLIFSRNLLNLTDSFPDIVNIFKTNFTGNFILDGELIAYSKLSGKNLSFQETIKRRRKHNVENFIESIPVKIYLFDILKLDKATLLTNTYHSRRDFLVQYFEKKQENILVVPEELLDLTGFQKNDSTTIQANDFLENYFAEMINEGFEGFVAKNYDSIYQAGKRGFAWIKIKEVNRPRLGDTIDAVIIGCYFGKGRRSKFGIGALLMGIWDPDKKLLQTIGKVGTGLSDSNLQTITAYFEHKKLNVKPENYEVHKNLYPDFWVIPELILELEADEVTLSEIHSAGNHLLNTGKGLSLRFPRVKSIRYDKSIDQSTTIEELLKIAKKDN